jgi:hypothetical protein
MTNRKNIYGGLNPIFESMASSLKEDKAKGETKTGKAVDVVSSVSTALNTVFTILLNSKNESAKTERGFEEIKNKLLGTTNFGAFRQYLVSLVESFGALDLAQRSSYDKNVKFLVEILSGDTEATLSDPKIFDSLKKDIVTKLLTNFSADLKDREAQMRKTNPKLFGEVVKQGLVVKENEEIDEERKSGDETDVEDAEFRSAAFNKSKESLDAANGFVGMIDRDKYVPALKDNGDVKRYKDIADDLYRKAQDIQMTDRKGVLGGKIVTPSGTFKAGDYKRKHDDLLNEIIRQKKEYSRIKDSILKNNNVTPAPVVTPICPPGKIYDEAKGICVDVKSDGGGGDGKKKITPTPVPTKECTFPIKLGKKCKDVGTIQTKLMEILPSVAEYLPKHGGVDSKYGSATAKVCNIVWAYVNKGTLTIDGELTKDMYDTIMGLTAEDVDKLCYKPITVEGSTGAKESISWEMSIEDKIEEREEIKGSPILSFEDFYSVIEESYKFHKIDEENIFSTIKNITSGTSTVAATGPTGATVTTVSNKKLIDCCVKDSILGNTLVDCIGASGASGASGETGGDLVWKGLKPVQDGTYTVFYDESWSDWWGDVAKGAVIAGIIIGLGVVTAGVGIAIAAPGAVTAAAVGTGIGTAAAAGGAAGATILWGGGIIGGTAIAKWVGNDRKPVSILVYNGYLEPVAVKGMARGLYNSMGGTISSQDMLAIYSTLILCRGTFTDDGDGKAVSVWEKIKKEYSSFDGDNLIADINAITTSQGVAGFFKDIGTDMDDLPSFPPNFKTKDPNRDGGSVTFEGAKDSCVDGVQKLDKNSSKLRENLTHITEKDLELLSDNMGEITEQVEAKMSGEGSEEE